MAMRKMRQKLLRSMGPGCTGEIRADVMTIDCLRSGKRILLILNDEQPNDISYQLTFKDKEPDEMFTSIPFDKLTTNVLYSWIKNYFAPT